MNRGNFTRNPAHVNNPNKHKEGTKLDRKTAKSIFLRLGSYVMRYWPIFFTAVIMTLVSNHLSLLGPMYSGDAIDAIAAVDGIKFSL